MAATIPRPLPTVDGPGREGDDGASAQTRADADRIIAHAARNLRELSGNDTREAFDAAGIPTSVRGPRFRAAVEAGLLRRIGYVRGTNPGNKGKPVALYSSMTYRPGPPMQGALDGLDG